MKKEVIIVPKGKCPMNVLAEMGEQTKNAWIFLHDNVKRNLENSADDVLFDPSGFFDILWDETEEYPSTKIKIESRARIWSKVYAIEASDIAFTIPCDDPEDIFFLKMEE